MSILFEMFASTDVVPQSKEADDTPKSLQMFFFFAAVKNQSLVNTDVLRSKIGVSRSQTNSWYYNCNERTFVNGIVVPADMD